MRGLGGNVEVKWRKQVNKSKIMGIRERKEREREYKVKGREGWRVTLREEQNEVK